MKAGGFPAAGTELCDPDFTAVVNASGLLGVRIEDPAELREGL